MIKTRCRKKRNRDYCGRKRKATKPITEKGNSKELLTLIAHEKDSQQNYKLRLEGKKDSRKYQFEERKKSGEAQWTVAGFRFFLKQKGSQQKNVISEPERFSRQMTAKVVVVCQLLSDGDEDVRSIVSIHLDFQPSAVLTCIAEITDYLSLLHHIPEILYSLLSYF